MTNFFQIIRLFALYRQAEMHQKALVVQKRYIQCQVNAFLKTQQPALLMMADMGAPVNLDSRPGQSKYPCAEVKNLSHGANSKDITSHLH